VLGEKLGDEPVDQSADVLEIVSEALFLRSSMVRPTLLMASKMLLCRGIAHRKCMSGIRELAREAYVSCISGFSLQCVHRFESSRLSDMSNCLFVTVFT
jgi:hypothetical protein